MSEPSTDVSSRRAARAGSGAHIGRDGAGAELGGRESRRDRRRPAAGTPNGAQDRRRGAYAARDDISLIKFHTAGVLQNVLDRAIQIHGAMGMTDETPLAFWYRHERAARIYDGPDEVHKWSVARRILSRYA